ncbi:MAG TPA: zf-HC2 domain-containing protein [Actinomycetota bacterium]|nr:zf-HC2 domain-containing protein [Actinomycetota bacterium]
MTHPTDQLVDLVDGTLTAPERDEVLAHVRACARCTAEVRAATEARRALEALATPVAPAGIGDRAVAEARRPAGTAAEGNRWTRIGPALGVAAAIVLGLALLLPSLGRDADVATEPAGDAAVPAAAPAASRVEVTDADYSLEDVRELAETGAAAAADAPGGEAFAGATSRSADDVIGCLTDAFRELPGVPTRLIAARFDGEPAYFGVVEAGPGAGQDPDRRYVLVASRPDCVSISQTRVLLP